MKLVGTFAMVIEIDKRGACDVASVGKGLQSRK